MTNKTLETSDHDEPIVIDNHPARVDFGDKHATTAGGGLTWEREFTEFFHQLLVITEDEAGNRIRHQVLNHLRGATITLDMVRASDASAKEKLTFQIQADGSGGHKVVMTPANNEFEKDGGQQGRLKARPGQDDFRLTKVSAGARSINLKPGGNFRKKVTVVLIGIPE